MSELFNDLHELAHLLELRIERLRACASVFAREQSDESLGRIFEQASSYHLDESDASAEAQLARSLCAIHQTADDTFGTFTRTEYARLFLGPRAVVVPLHESAYRSGVKRTFTSDTLAVRSAYAQAGYVVKRKNQEPDDSVSHELEFMACLLERLVNLIEDHEYERLLDQLDVYDAFVHGHPAQWLSDFCQGVINQDASRFYAAWACYLETVLQEDAAQSASLRALLERCVTSSRGNHSSLLLTAAG